MTTLQPVFAKIKSAVEGSDNPLAVIEQIRDFLHELSPNKAMPIDRVQWVPLDQVSPNDYNPNSVAAIEMQLLVTSIAHDGYTQPIVTIKDMDRYVIVDGFHRYFVMKNNQEIRESCHGLLPVTVINKGINDRMASTVRHNRARGKHSVSGMANMVFSMLDNGWSDSAICNELGMEPEELLRLKHVTGFSKLFADTTYNREWVTRNQILIKAKYEESQQK